MWATKFQFLGAQMATKALKFICSTDKVFVFEYNQADR